jgi:hypothetical protein
MVPNVGQTFLCTNVTAILIKWQLFLKSQRWLKIDKLVVGLLITSIILCPAFGTPVVPDKRSVTENE